MIKGLICDLDGTLIDSEPPHHESYRMAFEEFGLSFDSRRYADMFGTNGELFVMKAAGSRVTLDFARRVVDRKTELYHELLMRDGMKPAPGANAFLERMRARYKLGLATATRRENLDLIFRLVGFDEVFHAVVAANDTENSKPDPEPFLLAASRLELPPSQCVVIEDGVHGIRAAKAAGMKCIAVKACDRYQRDLSGADLVLPSLEYITYQTIETLDAQTDP